MKKLLLFTVLILSVNSFAQKCSYSIDKTDEFTKKRTARTKAETLFENKSGAFWNSALFDIENTKVEFFVSADYDGGIRSLLFILNESNNAKHTEDYSALQLLLTTDSVITFYKPANEGYKYDGAYMYWRFYTLTDDQWNYLKVTPIKKIRLHYEDNTQGDIEINKKYVNSISNVINCLDDLNLPITQVQEKDEIKTIPKQETKDELPVPTNDTASISIYKQWKVVVSIGKDGIPKSNVNQIIQYNNNGTYKSTITSTGGGKIESKGTFQILNDNKVIVNTSDDGKISSAAITKLTNKELDLKGEEFQTIFVVY